MPATSSYLMVGAPHTSNWDFVYMLLITRAIGLNPRFIGKDSLFRFPLGGVMRRLGGIPVNRGVRTNFVQQIVAAFRSQENLVVLISPEGTRSKTKTWKTGFYYIASESGVPIALGFLDYPSKTGGIDGFFIPSGDILADMELVRAFYRGKRGKYPDQQSEPRLAMEAGENPA